LRLAIFGGTFDPIHFAHLEVAREAARAFGLSRVLFVPAARPPHKTGATSAAYEDRYNMVALACEHDPLFEASRLEAGNQRSYSINTIEKVKAALAPEDKLFFLIGADAFAEIQTWYRRQDVIREVEFIVVTRPGHNYSVPPGARVQRLDTLALAVSSSEIRARLGAGEEPPEVPAAVLAYILDRGLYRNPKRSGATQAHHPA
jgi:nicotinate-nucleotide adenylyltransferase